MATFVLVHGAMHGELVLAGSSEQTASGLAGHDVHAPTLTGHG